MVSEDLAGTQASWCFQRAWLPFQLWSRSRMVSARVELVSRWNGLTLEAPPRVGCFQTGWPFGRSMGRGSPKPRTPRRVP